MSMPLNKATNTFIHIIERVSHRFSIIGVIALAGLMLMTVSDVLLRYFFAAPIKGSLEITELLIIVVVFPGLAWVAVRRANVKVDLVIGRFSTRTQGIFDSITCFMSLVVAALIAWFNIPQAFYMWNLLIQTDLLGIVHFPFFFLISFACFILCLALITNLIESVNKAVKG